mgnify:CR=1 FL=1
MRHTFFEELTSRMETDLRIWAVTADLGMGGFDKIKKRFPDRFLNTGAAEHAALNICIGLALQGRIPFFYSITPFALFRPFESLKLYIAEEKIPVKIIGSGRGKNYHIDGPSHDATQARDILRLFPGIFERWPETKEEIPKIVDEMINTESPFFLSLKR